MEDQVPLEVTNSLRLAHQALSERGRTKAQDVSPLELFYERMWQIALPHKPFQKLPRPGIEAFYAGNMDKDEFVALFKKNILVEGYVQDVSALTEHCFNTFLSVGSREQQVDKYISKQAARQLWQVFAKLDRFGRLGLPNEEVNELLLRVAALSQLETLTSDMARVATMELVDFWQFMEILIAQVFKKFNKQFSQKMIQDLHDDIVHELLKKGMLKKRGHVRKNWKERFFVLTVRSLTYYESQSNLTKKGQLTINQSSSVMLVTEAGKPTECSVRFRVTCGGTGTATDIIAEDCDVAMEWVKAIQVAIAFHQINEKQSRNFLHQLTLARKRVKGAAVAVQEEALVSPLADTHFTYPAAGSPTGDYKNGSSPTEARGQKSFEMRKPHEYEDVDKVADICSQVVSQSPSATDKRTLSPSKSTSVVESEVEYTVVHKKKISQPEFKTDEELPPPVPKRAGAKSSDDDPLMYVDLRFSSSGGIVLGHENQGTKKQQKKADTVEYTDIDAVAMLALASPTTEDVTGGSKERKTSAEQHNAGSNLRTKPMIDVTHEKHAARKPSADGDYINIHYEEKASAGSDKKMIDVASLPKRQASKDGDYVGVSYDAGGRYVAQSQGRKFDHIAEAPSSLGERQDGKDYINLVSVTEAVQASTSKPMIDVTDERPSEKQGGDDNYVGLVYRDASSVSKDSNGSRHRGAPPSVPMPYSSDDLDSGYVTIQAPDGPPQPKPRKNIPKRPVSMVERGQKSDALGVVHGGETHSRALTPSPDLGAEARKHDYVLLLPDAPTGESTEKSKKPPPVPKPYHETHCYVNTSKPLSSSGKPALPPKSHN